MNNFWSLLCCCIIITIKGCQFADNTSKSRSYRPIPDLPSRNNFYLATSQQALQEAIEDDPEDTESRYKLALIYHHTFKPSAALSQLEKAIELRPDSAKYHFLLSYIYSRLNAPDRAIKSFEKAIQLKSNYPLWWLWGVELYIHKKDLKAAVNWLTQTEKALPAYAEVYFWKSKLAVIQQDTLNAYKNFERAIITEPHFLKAYFEAASFSNHLEKFETALQWADKGLKYKATYDSLLLEKATALEGLLKKQEALEIYFQTYKLNPTLHKAAYMLGQASFKEGKYQEAYTYLLPIIEAKKEFPKIYFYVGVAYQSQGNRQKAIEMYRRAIDQDPQDLLARQYLYTLQQQIQFERLQRRQDSLLKATQQPLF